MYGLLWNCVSRLVAASIEQIMMKKELFGHIAAPFDINIISIGHDKIRHERFNETTKILPDELFSTTR